MPIGPIVAGLAICQADTLAARPTGSSPSLKEQALATSFLFQHKDIVGHNTCILVECFKPTDVPCKWSASTQSLLDLLVMVHIAVPRTLIFTMLVFSMSKVGKLIKLVRKLTIPGIDSPGPILDRVTNMMVSGTRPPIGAPHVGNLGMHGSDYLTSAYPHSNTLVNVLTSPTKHIRIVATTLLPPPSRHTSQATREHAHVHVIRSSPFEVTIPRDVALGTATVASANLRPSVNVQCSNLWNHHSAVILCNELKEIQMPILLRSNMAIQEHQNVTSGTVATSLLGADKTHCLLMPEYLHFELLLYFGRQVSL
mmetsp:Transcript_28120/g.64960  ORF Transcript_28120/g.64960 Transcript_28120/m.64960 type:complete len:311 (-) Transcript_28120:33-965(-)